MDKQVAKRIVDACRSQGHNADIYEGYSGRGMYGSETTGVTADSKSIIIQSIINESKLFDDLNISELRSDSMGLETIIY